MANLNPLGIDLTSGQVRSLSSSDTLTNSAGSTISSNLGPKYPDLIPTSPNSYDDEFDGTSLDGKWSTTSTPTGWVATVGNGALKITQDVGATFGFISQNPGSTFTITSRCECLPTTMSAFPMAGLIARRSANGKLINIGMGIQGGAAWRLMVNKYNGLDSNTDYVSSPFDDPNHFRAGIYYLRIRQDGTTLYFEYSSMGYHFVTLFSEAFATFLGGAADQVGPFIMTNTTSCYGIFDWIRKS